MFVVGLVGGDDVVGAEFFAGMDAGGLAHFAAAVGARENFDSVAGGFLYIARIHQITVHTVLDDFGHAASVRADDGNFAGHGFESGEAEGLELRRKKEKVGGGKLFVDGVLLAKEEHVFLEFFLADEIFGGAAVGAVADEDELGGHFGANESEDFDGVGEAFDRAEVREVHQDGFAVGRPLLAEALVGGTAVEIAVDEIGDHFDGALDVEFLKGLAEKIAGDGSDAVALLDGKLRDGKIAAVAADEGDVRAVKRGDERKPTGSGHGAREQGADGMRNGVMNVEKVERGRLENLKHFGGKSESVGRMVEERVGDDFDFVEVNALAVRGHADGRGVADEMDFVAAGGELHAKLGGDDARAAVGGIAGDADAHKESFKL